MDGSTQETVIKITMEYINILNARIRNCTQIELLEKLKEGVLITPNIDHIVKLQRDREFYDIYQKAEWVICDSKVLYFVSKLLPKSFIEAIPGSSFFTAYYEYHRNNPECKYSY